MVMGAHAAGAQSPPSFARTVVSSVTKAYSSSDVRSPRFPPAARGLVWVDRVAHSDPVAAIRVYVTITGAGTGWSLVIRSEATGVVTDTITPQTPLDAAGGFWSGDVHGSVAEVSLNTKGDVSGLTVAIATYGYSVMSAQQQAIHGIDARLNITEAGPRVQELARPVVRLRTMVPNLGESSCTGFLLNDRLVLTNEHCVTTDAEARATLVDLGYETGKKPVTLRVEALLSDDAALDYALLRLERAAPAAWGRVTLDPASKIAVDQRLILIEHPLGGFKQVSLESCEISDEKIAGATAAPTDFGHRCDTLVGSSGSPVMDDGSGAVIGLHHLGFDAAKKIYVNRAVPIRLVLTHIRSTLGWTTVPP